MRKLEPGADRFLPEAPDTLVRINVLPAFRLAELWRRGAITGSTRLAPADVTPVVLTPGRWAVERAYTSATTGNLILSSDSLVGLSGSRLSSWEFEIAAGEVIALPLIRVAASDRMGSAGPAHLSLGGGAPEVSAIASQRGLTAEVRDWSRVTVACEPIEYSGFQLRGEARCAPR